MKKILLLTSVFTLFTAMVFPNDFKNRVMVMTGFDTVQTDEEDYMLNPSVAARYMRMKEEGVESSQLDRIMAAAGYSQNYYTSGIGPDGIKTTHGVNLMGSVAKGKNSGMLMVMSDGEELFSSLKTITGVAMYNHQFVETDEMSFSFGGGVIVHEMHIKQWDLTLYAIPLPVFMFEYQNDIFATTVAVQGMPHISFTLFPKAAFRFNCELGMLGADSIRDLGFDCSLAYYPLAKQGKDFLSASAGIMNSKTTTVLKDEKEYSLQYYTVYGEVNAMIAKIRCGYNFDGKKFVDDEECGDLQKGLFASIQVMCMF